MAKSAGDLGVGGLSAPATTTSVFLAGIIVSLGSWARGKGVNPRVWVGVGIAAIMLSALSNVNENIARKLGLIMLISAMFVPVDGEAMIVTMVAYMKGERQPHDDFFKAPQQPAQGGPTPPVGQGQPGRPDATGDERGGQNLLQRLNPLNTTPTPVPGSLGFFNWLKSKGGQ